MSLSKYRKELDFIFGVEIQALENLQDVSNCEFGSENKRLKTSVSSCLPCSGDMTYLPMQVFNVIPHYHDIVDFNMRLKL